MIVIGGEVADDWNTGQAIAAGKRAKSSLPARDEALRAQKLNALYSFQGDKRRELSREFCRIDRRHYCVNGISRVEYKRETVEEIERWLR